MEIEFDITKITQLVVEIAKSKDIENSIALIVMYGSRAKGTYNDNSDLEFIAICEDKENLINFDFMLNGIPIDLWSTTWESLELIAQRKMYWVLPAGSFATAKIMYNRSSQDKIRYNTIVGLLSSENAKKHHFEGVKRAENVFEDMKKSLGEVQLAILQEDLVQTRVHLWEIINAAATILANLHDTYLTENWGVNLKQVFLLPRCPLEWSDIMLRMTTSQNYIEINSLALQLVESCRNILIKELKGRENTDQIEMLAATGALEYANKILKAINNEDWLGVSYAVYDSIPWIAQDLMKLKNKWDQSRKYLHFSEIREEYDKLEISDFSNILTNMDKTALINESRKFLHQIQNLISKYSKTKNFSSLEEVRIAYVIK